MRRYHVTPTHNTHPILREGILVAKSQCSGRIYAVNARRLPWAIKHVRARHGVVAVAVIEIYTTAADLERKVKRWFRASPGVWYTTRDVQPTNIVGNRRR